MVDDRITLASLGFYADIMRTLDEPERNWAIEHADNVIDMRHKFEGMQLMRHIVSVAYIWDDELE